MSHQRDAGQTLPLAHAEDRRAQLGNKSFVMDRLITIETLVILGAECFGHPAIIGFHITF